MTRRLIGICAAAILIIQALGCGSTSVTQMTAPDAARCQASLGAMPILPASGGRLDVGVVTQRECAWTITSNAAWIQVSPSTGQGESSVTLTTAANPQATNRTGNITLNGTQFPVTQSAAACTFAASPATLSIPADGGTGVIHVTSLVGCSWSASSPAPWAVVKPLTTSASDDVTVTVAGNDSTSSRSVTLSIAGLTVQVTQAGRPATPTPTPAPTPSPSPAPGPTPPPTPDTCTYSIDPPMRNIKVKGGGGTVKVTTGSTCPWTAVSNADWIQVKEDSTSGTGTRDVKYDVDRNSTGLPRLGTVTVAGLPHLVAQDGGDGGN